MPELFSKFNPTEDKIKALSKKLMEEPLYLPDEYRDYGFIHKMLFNNFGNENNIFYEIGEWDGLIGFIGIIPTFKCDIIFKLWNKELWGKSFVRQVIQLIESTMNKYKLQRIATESPDLKMVKLAKLCKFKVEGRFKNAFVWEDKMYTIHKMRILKEDIE